MRITELAIQGFGLFHDLVIRDFSPGITVFVGPNEAGKSTLMAFIRGILFGFDGRRAGHNRYEPLGGGRYGGSLVLELPDGARYRVERMESEARGRAKVVALFPFQRGLPEPNNGLHDDELLQRLLYGTSKRLFQNVFAFSLSELERLDTLQSEEITNHIYTIGMGTGLTPIGVVQAALEQEQAQLFKPGGKKPIINQLLHKLEQTSNLIRELQALPDEYQALQARLKGLDQEIVHYQEQLDLLTGQVDRLESLLRAREEWEQLQIVRRELREHPTVEHFPAGGVERLEQLERALAAVENRLDSTRRAIKKIAERKAELQPAFRVLTMQAEIEALEELRVQSKGQLDTLNDLRTRAAFRRKVLDEILGRLGAAWDDARLERFDASIPVREQVRSLRDRLDRCRQALVEAQREEQAVVRTKQEKEGELERLQERIEQLVSTTPKAKAPLSEREQAIRHWFQLHHRLELTKQHHRDLQEQLRVLEERISAHVREIHLTQAQKGIPVWVLLILVGLVIAPAGVLGLSSLHVL
ncbi:MAG: hypothetical protein D6704_07390, partial [Nitrospirae bacterium]